MVDVLLNPMIGVGGHRFIEVRALHGLKSGHDFMTPKAQAHCASERRASEV